MKDLHTKIALQLYTVREHLTTPQDVEHSLKKIHDIGYQAVELAGITCLDDVSLRRLFDAYQLACCSMHVSVAQIADELDNTIERMSILGCSHIAVAWSGPEYRTADGVKQLAKILDTAGKRLRESGLMLSYHNHKFEFGKIGEYVMLEHLLRLTDPQHLLLELDVCWAQLSGANPAAWIRNARGRMWAAHYKDATIKNDAPVLAEIGEGNLDWLGIIQACEETKVVMYIIEQDICERNPFDSIAMSYRNLKALGVR